MTQMNKTIKALEHAQNLMFGLSGMVREGDLKGMPEALGAMKADLEKLAERCKR